MRRVRRSQPSSRPKIALQLAYSASGRQRRSPGARIAPRAAYAQPRGVAGSPDPDRASGRPGGHRLRCRPARVSAVRRGAEQVGCGSGDGSVAREGEV